MQVIVELNTDREILWALPGNVMAPLTLGSPRVAIETDKLTDLQKAALVTAINLQKVKSSAKPEEFFSSKPKAIHEVPKKLGPSQHEQLVKKLTEEREVAIAKTKEILALSTGEIKKEIMKIKDLKFLGFMRTLEQEGKKRATVLKAIDQAVLDISLAISKSIQIDVAGTPLKLPDPAKMEFLGTTVNYDVVEFEEERTVTIAVPPKGD